MKFIICLAAFVSLSFSASCANSSKTQSVQEEVIFDDGYRAAGGGEIIFDDRSLSKGTPTAMKQINAAETISTKNAQGATVSTMTDSAGNKSDNVCFDNHPLVGCVVLKTTAKGEKEILVYGRNGTVKTLSADKIENVFTVTASEAARAAEITEGRNYGQTSTMFAQQQPNAPPLQPLPSYKFNVQKPMPVETSAEAGQIPADASAAPVEPDGIQAEEKREAATENRPPDGEKEN